MAEQKDKSTPEEQSLTSQISRREFLKDAGLVVSGATIGSMAIFSACKGETATVTSTNTVTTTATGAATTVTSPGGTATVTSPPVTTTITVTAIPEVTVSTIKLTVNGKAYQLQVNPEDTLQDVLRGQLGLASPKDMCFGWGACGSCSVILDGRPILSCMSLAAELDNATVETAEGIADAKHPIISAFNEAYAIQCGYCTPGFIVTAKALLDHDPHPTNEKIREALGGNLCRCGTYPRMSVAVGIAATKLGGK